MKIIIDRLNNILGLSLSLAKAEFKLRNEGTYLGIFWYLLAPLLTFLLLLGIFSNNLGKDIPNYPLYLLLGILLFNYSNRIISESLTSIRNNSGIIKSINFPRESLIGKTVISVFFSHVFEIIIFILFLLFFGVSIKMMIFYPIILLFLSLFLFGFSLILSSLGVYFFDLDNVWRFFSSLVLFITPIFYDIGNEGKLFLLNLFNPLYYFITIPRDIVIYSKIPETWILMGALFYTLLSLLIGIIMFNKLKIKFAELI
ncbi:MAG TPA: ABC transporter permease [Candidatus Nanoarchaeia archaeon]|nr:ABC transporter permease [Candidatus Nanoarchaeia archaeon]